MEEIPLQTAALHLFRHVSYPPRNRAGKYSPWYSRLHHAPLRERSANEVNRYLKVEALMNRGGCLGKGFPLNNEKTSGDPWSSRTIKFSNQGFSSDLSRAANHICQSRRG